MASHASAAKADGPGPGPGAPRSVDPKRRHDARRSSEDARPLRIPGNGQARADGWAEQPALADVSFQVRPGERIAIVGANGSGKTTLVKLLMGLYAPTGGALRYDDVSVTEIDLADLRSRVGSVSQQFVRYDVGAGEHRLRRVERLADEPTIHEAAARGGALGVAEGLASGLDTMLGKTFGGTELSGGQWQKLAISRAFMRDITGADVLILDEPTSGLDPQAEADVFARFAEIAQGKTAFLIAHRLGSARIADRILLIKEGRLIE